MTSQLRHASFLARLKLKERDSVAYARLQRLGTFVNGSNFSSAVEAGMNGAATGFATGAITGAAMSIPYAKANNINPLTGRSTVRPQIDPIAPLPYAGDIRSQALDLKDNYNGGRNTVNIRTAAKEMQYDLDGEPHYNKSLKQYVSTPHTSSHEIHRGPNGKINLRRGDAVPMNQQDIRIIRNYLQKSYLAPSPNSRGLTPVGF